MTFIYHANAVALGGIVHRPCCDILPSTASLTLSPSGGEASLTVRDYNYKSIITFDEASVYVAGSRKGNFRNTISTVAIRNLNVLNMIHVGYVVARVTSEHYLKNGVAVDEPQFTFEGSRLENLYIGGVKRDVVLNHAIFSRYGTFSEFQKAFTPGGAEANDIPRYARRFGWGDDCGKQGPPQRHGTIRASLVESIDIPEQDGPDPSEELALRRRDREMPIRRDGCNIRITDFGQISLGEVMLKDGERRINMLRMTLGCPNDIDMTAASTATNGTEMHPP